MITQATAPTQAQINAALLWYWDGGSNSGSVQYVGIYPSDLNTASLPAAITSAPKSVISQVTGTPFTIPSGFVGVHAFSQSLPALAAAGSKSVHTHDLFVNGFNMQFPAINPSGVNSSGVLSFTVGTSTVNWASHGLTASLLGVFFSNSGGALPTGVVAFHPYYITNVTTNSFQLIDAITGLAIVMSGSATGTSYVFSFLRVVSDPGILTGTTPGSFVTLVKTATAKGMDVVFDCTNIPAYCSVDSTQANIPTSSFYVTSFIGFLNTLSILCSANPPQYWDIWNEVNTSGSFNGTTTGTNNALYQYAVMIKSALNTAGASGQKTCSPSWNTISGATPMATWLTASSASAQCDVLSFHTYGDYVGFDTTSVDAYVSALSGFSKPLWITEVGDSAVSQIALWRGHLYAAAKGIARIYWYNYDLGTGEPPSNTGNLQITAYPGLAAQYQAMITKIVGASCTYVNRTCPGSTGGAVGANINNVNYIDGVPQ